MSEATGIAECHHDIGAATRTGWRCLRCEESTEFIPGGIAFHVEVALTQARMACRKAAALSVNMPSGQFADEQGEVEKHLASVIEQLGEIDAKIKAKM